MRFLEKDLEEIIYSATKEELRNCGLFFNHSTVKRQLRIGNYGTADLVGFRRGLVYNGSVVENPIITIYELKKEKISVSSFIQAIRYLKGVQRYLIKRGIDPESYDYKIVVIGSEMDTTSDIVYLPDLIQSNEIMVRFYTYDFKINGIVFKEIEGYCLIEEGF